MFLIDAGCPICGRFEGKGVFMGIGAPFGMRFDQDGNPVVGIHTLL